MAEQSAIAAPFPAPPPFYKHFTKANLAALRQRRRDAGLPLRSSSQDSTQDDGADLDVRTLPAELRFLIPPEPPVDGKYTTFGLEIDRNAPETTLAASGIEQVYPSHPSVSLNPQPHMIDLARSLLASFLSLVGILSVNPELYQEKTQDLQTLMYNIHDLVNQYRPHQARETLILLMEERIKKLRQENQAIDDAKKKISGLLEGLHRDGTRVTLENVETTQKPAGATVDKQKEPRERRQRAAFDSLEEDLG